MITDTDKKLLRARASIILNHNTAFYAGLMMQKPMIMDESVKTACTNGEVIKYNPAFVDKQTNEQLQGLIIHELMHIHSLHPTRRNGRDMSQWNEACDYAINQILIDGKIELPDGALVNHKYRGMSAEAIYNDLTKQKEKEQKDKPKQSDSGQPAGGNGNGNPDPTSANSGQQNKPQPQPEYGIGGVEDSPAQSKSDVAATEAKAKQQLAQAMTIAKHMGNLPAGMDRIIDEILKPVVDWQEALARFVSEVAHNDYSFSKPNLRYASSGFILPSLHNIEMGELVLIVDTSGSIDEGLLKTFASEMQEIASSFNSKITVIYVDTKVHGVDVIEPDDTFTLHPKGGGGTSFIPAFPYMQENEITPRAIVYFTDGYSTRFPDEPDVPVLWATYNNSSFEPPFGEVIRVDI